MTVLQDVADALAHTLDLPTILPHGAQIDPTADGFLISLPTCKFADLLNNRAYAAD